MQRKVEQKEPKLTLGTYHLQLCDASVDVDQVPPQNEDRVVENGDGYHEEIVSTEGAAHLPKGGR